MKANFSLHKCAAKAFSYVDYESKKQRVDVFRQTFLGMVSEKLKEVFQVFLLFQVENTNYPVLLFFHEKVEI